MLQDKTREQPRSDWASFTLQRVGTGKAMQQEFARQTSIPCKQSSIVSVSAPCRCELSKYVAHESGDSARLTLNTDSRAERSEKRHDLSPRSLHLGWACGQHKHHARHWFHVACAEQKFGALPNEFLELRLIYSGKSWSTLILTTVLVEGFKASHEIWRAAIGSDSRCTILDSKGTHVFWSCPCIASHRIYKKTHLFDKIPGSPMPRLQSIDRRLGASDPFF